MALNDRAILKPTEGFIWPDKIASVAAKINEGKGKDLPQSEWKKFKDELRQFDEQAYRVWTRSHDRRRAIRAAFKLSISELEEIIAKKKEGGSANGR